MPITNSNDFNSYAFEFDEAYKRIQIAINHLKAKGVKIIVLFGHSMGSRMMSAFVRKNPKLVDGLIIAGCRNTKTHILDCGDHVANIRIKILDIYGSGDSKDSNSANDRNYLVSARYTQKPIKNANHKFDGYNQELTKAISDWLLKNL
jgi:dienelactone hydrolase